MALDEPTEKDEVIDGEGFRIVVDKELIEQVGGLHVDFVDQGFASGFSIRTANQTGSDCGGCSC